MQEKLVEADRIDPDVDTDVSTDNDNRDWDASARDLSDDRVDSTPDAARHVASDRPDTGTDRPDRDV